MKKETTLSVLKEIRDLLKQQKEPVTKCNALIDCDAKPFVPVGWEIRPEDQLRNAVTGKIKFDPAKVKFYLDDTQKEGHFVNGFNLKKQIAKLPNVYGSKVLDYLFENQEMIPESWNLDEQGRTRYIYFWGTIYRDSDGALYVRYLYWDVGGWDWRYGWLGGRWGVRDPAAVPES